MCKQPTKLTPGAASLKTHRGTPAGRLWPGTGDPHTVPLFLGPLSLTYARSDELLLSGERLVIGFLETHEVAREPDLILDFGLRVTNGSQNECHVHWSRYPSKVTEGVWPSAAVTCPG